MSINFHHRQTEIDRPQGLAGKGGVRRVATQGAMLLSLTALAIAGCGGSAKLESSSSTGAFAIAPVAAQASGGGQVGTPSKGGGSVKSRTHGASKSTDHAVQRSHRTVKSHDLITSGTVIQRPVAGTGGATHNDDNPGRADAGPAHAQRGQLVAGQINPCMLVPESDAEAIVGRPLDTPLEAPLGPTCIYQSPGQRTSITLTVQAIDMSQIKPHMKHSKPLIVGGHPAICGSYGRPTTFVPLARDEVLTVTAPCEVGRRFAAVALPRLST